MTLHSRAARYGATLFPLFFFDCDDRLSAPKPFFFFKHIWSPSLTLFISLTCFPFSPILLSQKKKKSMIEKKSKICGRAEQPLKRKMGNGSFLFFHWPALGMHFSFTNLFPVFTKPPHIHLWASGACFLLHSKKFVGTQRKRVKKRGS